MIFSRLKLIMKIPRVISILGTKYKIKRVKLVELLGECDKENKIILIDKNITCPKLLQATFIHETYHATLHELGIDMVVPIEVEEMLCYNQERYFEAMVKKIYGKKPR